MAHTTVATTRDVLIYARTSVTTRWLLDLAREVLADRRVQVRFTIEDEQPSASAASARELVAAVGGLTVPWKEAVAATWDLVLASSPRGSYTDLSGPLLLTQHGPAFGKPASVLGGGPVPVPRDPGGRIRRKGLPLTTLLVSHPEQSRLFGDLPDGVDVVAVGDPLLDRLLASASSRERFRERLEVRGGQRLLVISSTWGPRSQFATDPGLWSRLAAALPLDTWRLATVVHPNVWAAHGRWQVESWTRHAADAGVATLSPGDDWRAGIVAADLVVADHGSVGLYAAALGVPVLLSGFDDGDVITGSPLAALGRRSPRLDAHTDLAGQVEAAAAVRPDPAWLTSRLTSSPGGSLTATRAVVYALLGLEPPAGRPRILVVDSPGPPPATPSFVAVAALAGVPGRSLVHVARHPASTPPPPPGMSGRATVVRLLGAWDDEPDTSVLNSADVVLRRADLPDGEAEAWTSRTLASLPGCALAATRDGPLVRLRWRDANTTVALEADPGLDLATVAAAAYAAGVGSGGRTTLEGTVSNGSVTGRVGPVPRQTD